MGSTKRKRQNLKELDKSTVETDSEAFAYKEKMYFRESTPKNELDSIAVHEGTHCLDNLYEYNLHWDEWTIEKRAFFFRRQYDKWTLHYEKRFVKKDWKNINDALDYPTIFDINKAVVEYYIP